MGIIQGLSFWVVFVLGILAGMLLLAVSIARFLGKRKGP